jgi:DNA-binding Lrp family transcriptional regulator
MDWNAQVWVKWNGEFPHRWTHDKWNWLSEWKEVKQAWSTMGEWDTCLVIDAKTPEELESFVWKKLRSNNWVKDTRSIWAREVWKS